MVLVIALCAIVLAALGARPVSAASVAAPSRAPNATIRDFARCVVADIKLIPQAKKYSPQDYQKFETLLTNAINASSGWRGVNQYLAAIRTGAVLARFFGYNLIWYLGAVQDCWRHLR
jgi:hypothetical protein